MDREFLQNRILELKKQITIASNEAAKLPSSQERLDAKENIRLMKTSLATNEMLLGLLKNKYKVTT